MRRFAILMLLGVPAAARAEMPLPSYRAALVSETWNEVNQLIEAGLREEAAAKAEAFEATVTEDGSLEYLVGLSWRLRDDPKRAEQHYQRAVALEPDLVEAWYDVGEIYVMEGRYDDAEHAFGEVDR